MTEDTDHRIAQLEREIAELKRLLPVKAVAQAPAPERGVAISYPLKVATVELPDSLEIAALQKIVLAWISTAKDSPNRRTAK